MGRQHFTLMSKLSKYKKIWCSSWGKLTLTLSKYFAVPENVHLNKFTVTLLRSWILFCTFHTEVSVWKPYPPLKKMKGKANCTTQENNMIEACSPHRTPCTGGWLNRQARWDKFWLLWHQFLPMWFHGIVSNGFPEYLKNPN